MSAYSKRKRTLKSRIRRAANNCPIGRNDDEIAEDQTHRRNKQADLCAQMRSDFVAAGCPNPPKRKSVRRQRCLTLPPIGADVLARIKPSNPKASYARTSTVRDYPCKPVGVDE